MKILWLGRIVPLPLNSGDRIYSAELIGAVARSGAIVDFLGLSNPDDEPGDVRVLESRVRWIRIPGRPRWKVLALFSLMPLVAARFATASYRSTLRKTLSGSRFDAVVLDQYALVWALPELKRLGKNVPRIIHVAHDYETELTALIASGYKGNPVKKFALWLNHFKTKAAEKALTRASNLIVTLTEDDAKAFRLLDARHLSLALPPGYAGPRSPKRQLLSVGGTKRVVIVGSFHWIAKQLNLEAFMHDAIPILSHAGITLNVAGSIPADVLAKWSASFPDVNFLGFVPNLPDALNGAFCALTIDAIGGGFKLKTLDYIFNGVPVAALQGTLHGLPKTLTDHFIIANESQDLARKIVAVSDDHATLSAMQRNAFAAADHLFDWNRNGQLFLKALNEMNQ
ncbi:glycosyltransferase [Methylobacterium flocculans]|uniref:glycosyltransferase n=1 Tax=Methylobacterium flocculans TaxID=2984843 RepID=UPI0021F3300B|nr:glycosyltransferase [Methylobacterium sp. FF17]